MIQPSKVDVSKQPPGLQLKPPPLPLVHPAGIHESAFLDDPLEPDENGSVVIGYGSIEGILNRDVLELDQLAKLSRIQPDEHRFLPRQAFPADVERHGLIEGQVES